MPKTIKETRERMSEIAARCKVLADTAVAETRALTEPEQKEWDTIREEHAALTKQAAMLDESERLSRESVLPPPESKVGRDDVDGSVSRRTTQPITDETRVTAFQAWLRRGEGLDLDDRHERACKLLRVNPSAPTFAGIQLIGSNEARALQANGPQNRALSAVTGASGGYTVPDSFGATLEQAMLHYGPMLQVATQIRTERGGTMPMPTANDTGNTGAQVGESAAVGTSTDPTFGAVILSDYKFTSGFVKTPQELLEDSAFDIAALLANMLGERLGRILNTKFTTGSGAATPKGIVTAATLGVTAASSVALTADEIINLVHSVDVAYRGTDKCGFMANDGIWLAIRKLKDGTGQYLWQPGYQLGVPDRILGYPIWTNNDMQATVATGTKTLLFGQLSKYVVRTVRDLRFYRLEERYRDNDQTGFGAFVRADGNLMDAGVAPVKYMIQA